MRRRIQQQTPVKEEKVQEQVCNWMKRQHPKMIFTCDLASGMKLTIGQAVKATKMRSSRGLPDLMIFEPRGPYMGMLLELKRKDIKIFRQDGEMIADAHIREQNAVLRQLAEKGYYAVFGLGFEDSVQKINAYLSLKWNNRK